MVPDPGKIVVQTENVDPEIGTIAGPQLVVPLSNARYAVNVANARWGSLYDALYGTDVIPDSGDCARGPGYNEARGAAVIARGKQFLDDAIPLSGASHNAIAQYTIKDGLLTASSSTGSKHPLVNPTQFCGYRGPLQHPEALLFIHNGLHIELLIDHAHPVGRADPAGIADVILEAAITTIMDMEDSVAAVDADDKLLIYRNWLGLIDSTLTASFRKNGRPFERALAAINAPADRPLP